MATGRPLNSPDGPESGSATGAEADSYQSLIDAQEDERRAIARELHDGIGQSITALLVGLRSLESLLPPDRHNQAARDLAHHLAATAVDTLNEIGRIARGLRPSVLDDAGLVAALRRHVDDFTRTHRVRVELHVSGVSDEQRLPPAVETACYRIVQEALTNVGKHAQASCASVIVERQRDRVGLIIEDDGRGMSEAQARRKSRRLGLLGIRERVGLLGGTVAVESAPGGGTALFVRLPLPGASE